jgi:hypothetical protein
MPARRREGPAHPCPMTNECAWSCSNLCTQQNVAQMAFAEYHYMIDAFRAMSHGHA